MVAGVGYANLTMRAWPRGPAPASPCSIAEWPNRAQLVLSAMRQRVVPIARDIPDTGQLRSDVLDLLRRVSQRYDDFGEDVMRGLMAELPDVRDEIFQVLPDVMLTILDNAANRGEVNPAKITPRIASLPLDLVRHHMFVTHVAAPEDMVAEIVDDVFLPLVRV